MAAMTVRREVKEVSRNKSDGLDYQKHVFAQELEVRNSLSGRKRGGRRTSLIRQR